MKKYGGTYLTLLVTHDLIVFSMSMVNPLLPIYAQQIGATGSVLGVVIASYSFSRAFLEIPSSIISSKFGLFRTLSVGILLINIGYLISAFAFHPFHLAFSRLLVGVGTSLFFTIALSFIVTLFDSNLRGNALGLFKSIQFVASVLGSMLSGYIISIINFKTSYLLSSLIIFLAFLLFITSSSIKKHPKSNHSSISISLPTFKTIFTNSNVIIICLATLAMFIMSSGIIFGV